MRSRPARRPLGSCSRFRSADVSTPTPDIVREVPRLAPRDPDANKGVFGVLIVAGSRGLSGAAVLCGSAALRQQQTRSRLIPESVLPIVAAGNPCYMTVPLPQDNDGRLSADAGRNSLK